MKKPKFHITKDTGIVVFDWLQLEVCVVFTKQQHEFMIKENGLEDAPFADDWGNVHGSMSTLHNGGVTSYVMVICDRNRRVITHESIHCVHHIMDEKGIPINLDNTEVMAYMTDYMVESVMDIVFNRKGKK